MAGLRTVCVINLAIAKKYCKWSAHQDRISSCQTGSEEGGQVVSISAILAVLVAPILIRWSFMLAKKTSEDGVTFRPAPTLRAVYPGGLLLSLWGVAFYLDEAWKSKFALHWNDW